MKVDIYNTDKKYSIIYADPPWSYKDNSCNGNALRHYQTMANSEISSLPVKKLSEKDCILFLWATYPKIREALEAIENWGFCYKTIAFQWVKLNKSVKIEDYSITTVSDVLKKSCFFGLGRWTRGNTECCLLATKGKPKRINASVSQLIFSPVKRHSEKPSEVREAIVKLVGDLSRIELFAREETKGWDCWGDEV